MGTFRTALEAAKARAKWLGAPEAMTIEEDAAAAAEEEEEAAPAAPTTAAPAPAITSAAAAGSIAERTSPAAPPPLPPPPPPPLSLPPPPPPTTVSTMLTYLNLAQYAAKFQELGHDDLDFLRDIAGEADGESQLREIGMECGMLPGHALRFSKKLGKVPAAGGAAGERTCSIVK